MIARYFPLALFLLVVVTASFFATGFEAGEWYHVTIIRPTWAPPHRLLGPASALVYVLLALSAWYVWQTGHFLRTSTLAWWGLLLVLNIAWSALFFGLNRPGWSMPVLGLALGVSLFCMRAFARLSREAMLLMVPYLLFTGFLLFLNFAIWMQNGGFLRGILS